MELSIEFDCERIGYLRIVADWNNHYAFSVSSIDNAEIALDKVLRMLPNLKDWDRVIYERHRGKAAQFKPLTLLLLSRFFKSSIIRNSEGLEGIPGYTPADNPLGGSISKYLDSSELKGLELTSI